MKIIDIILRLTSPSLKKKMDKRSHLENSLSMLRMYRERTRKSDFKKRVKNRYRQLSEHEKLECDIERLKGVQDRIIGRD